jgi:hypothetical protein
VERGQRFRGAGGATMVEFAIVSIVLFLLIFGAAQLALIEGGNSSGGNAAREGARIGIINYACADSYTGTLAPGGSTHTGADASNNACPAPPNGTAYSSSSTNYNNIVTAVTHRLQGLAVLSSIKVDVACYKVPSGSGAPTVENCAIGTPPNGINVDTDLIEVKVAYTTLGSGISVFNAASGHTQTARMVIVAAPLITATTSTSSTSTTSTSTTSTSTTSTSTTSTTSATPLSVSSLVFQDPGHTGHITQVLATFGPSSPALAAACANTWSSSTVPHGQGMGTPAVVGQTVVIPITGTNVGTDGPGFLMTFTPASGCNATGFANRTVVDNASPVVMSISFDGGAPDGLLDTGDTMAITFSEPVINVPATVDIVQTQPNGNNKNTSMTIVGTGASTGNDIMTTSTDLNSTYLSMNAPTQTIPASAAISGSVVTVTVSSCPVSTTCSKEVTGAAGSWAFPPATNLTDAAANLPAVLATPAPGSVKTF